MEAKEEEINTSSKDRIRITFHHLYWSQLLATKSSMSIFQRHNGQNARIHRTPSFGLWFYSRRNLFSQATRAKTASMSSRRKRQKATLQEEPVTTGPSCRASLIFQHLYRSKFQREKGSMSLLLKNSGYKSTVNRRPS